MEKIKFYERIEDLKKVDDGLKVTQTALEFILEEWSKITGKAPLTMEMVTAMMKKNHLGARLPDPDKIMELVMTEHVRNNPLFGEIDLDDLIRMKSRKPDITALVEAVRGLGGYIPGPLTDPTDQFRPECFTIDKGKVRMVETAVNERRSLYIAYATNQEEHARLRLVQGVIDAYNRIREEYPDISLNKAGYSGMIIYNPILDILVPDPSFVKEGRIPSSFRADLINRHMDGDRTTIGDIRSQVTHETAPGHIGEEEMIRRITQRRNAMAQ